ncbi:MAG: aldehyde ferredoxin oxidoreductase N-terminal domain-containing protein [Faecalibacterium sp.]
MAETYGWAGKILRVNLTTGEITTQDDEKYHKYIGGMGMAYRIMYEEAPMELDPYDEKALVIFGVGPLTGAGVPCSGRMNVHLPLHLVQGSAPSSTHTWAATSAPC